MPKELKAAGSNEKISAFNSLAVIHKIHIN
jgi:hypothetical protein